MATDTKLTARAGYNGYAVLELNQVAFPRDGRIEAQLPLDGTLFARATGVPAEVGMILKVDKAGGVIKFAESTDKVGTLYALNYSTEHMYDERLPQLKNFCQYAADSSSDMLGYDDFYPRLGYLAVGDRFTTNAIVCDDAADVKTLVGKFLTASVATGFEGYWEEIAAADVGDAVAPVVQIVEGTTCPNGIDPAVKVVVVKA